MTNLVLKSKIFSKLFIPSSIRHKINKSILVYWIKFQANIHQCSCLSLINKCNNLSTFGPNKLSWRHLKTIVNDSRYLRKFVDIADACFELDYWPSHFKISTSIIIPKPNKESYDSPKSFRPIVLLNIISKLIKKGIGERL